MNDPLKTIESLQNLKLSNTEKSEMFSHIQNHINESLEKPIPSPYTPFNLWSLLRNHGVYASALAVLLVLAGGSAAAETALPGDILYPIKRNINEEVMQVFAFNTESKAEVQIKLVERRFEEAEKIIAINTEENSDENAEENLKHEETLTALATDIQAHATEALDHIEDVQTETSIVSAVELTNELGTVITAHDSFIDSVTEEPVHMEAAAMTMMAKSAEPTALMATANIETESSLQSIIDETRNQVEMASFELSYHVSSSETDLVTEEKIQEDKAELVDTLENEDISNMTKEVVRSLITSAEESLKQNDVNNAFIMLQEATKISQNELKIDAIENESSFSPSSTELPSENIELLSTTTVITE